jgi:hypothetical protein
VVVRPRMGVAEREPSARPAADPQPLVTEEGLTVDIDPRFAEHFNRLLERHDLTKFDRLMEYHGPFDELPLFAMYSEISFLDDLPPGERNRILIRAAVAHLHKILDYSRTYYAGRDYDYFCAVTVTNWEFVEEEGDPIIPRFFYANPSHGVFASAPPGPPTTKYSRMVEDWLNHSTDYIVNEDVVPAPFGETRVERLYVQHESCLAPINNASKSHD